MPHISLEDNLDSLNRLSFREILIHTNFRGNLLGSVTRTRSRFAEFHKNKNSLESFIVTFVNSSPKSFLWLNMKKFEFSLLTAISQKFVRSS